MGEGLLESVSLPSLVMIGGDGEGLTVSAADPDLRFYEGSVYSRKWIDNPSGESQLEVVIRGRWQSADDRPECRIEPAGENTALIFTCREGATREVNLIEMK